MEVSHNYNHYCVDCGSYSVKYLSVNNGVFICESCAKEHKLLGKKYSTLEKIGSEINVYDDMFALRGGNLRFGQLIDKYNLNKISIELKYKTKAVNYYRKLIYSEVFCEDPPIEISFEEGIRLCNEDEVFIVDYDALHKIEVNNYDEMIKKSRGIMGSVIDFLNLQNNEDDIEEDNKEDFDEIADVEFHNQLSQAIENSMFDNNVQYVNDSNNYPCPQLPKENMFNIYKKN